MKKKKLFAFFALLLAVLFCFCACKADFVGNKIKVGNKYTLSFSVLNKTEKETLNLKKGQTLKVSLSLEQGSVSLKIGKKDKLVIYKGTDLFESADFALEIPENGRYLIFVGGKQAKGKIVFEVA